MAYQKDENEIGALWTRQGARGAYMSGKIEINGEEISIVCFALKKASENSPDWRVLKSVPRKNAPQAQIEVPYSSDIPF